MLDFLGESKAAQKLMVAFEAVTAAGSLLTPDLGGKARTQEFTDAVLEKLAD